MAEKCLMAITIAALLCHPSSTLRCFKPNPNSQSTPKRHKPITLKSKKKKTKTTQILGHLSAPALHVNNKISQVLKGDPLFGLVETIIRSSWSDKTSLEIKRVLRVSHGIRTLVKFEQYRQVIKLKSSKASKDMLQFHAATICSSLGKNPKKGSRFACADRLCFGCRVLASGLCFEDFGSVSFFGESFEAHEKVKNGCFGDGKRALVVCRVIAGRIGRCDRHGLMIDGEEGGFDSLVRSSCEDRSDGNEELIVLNPRAVLPCFVVTYNTQTRKVKKQIV